MDSVHLMNTADLCWELQTQVVHCVQIINRDTDTEMWVEHFSYSLSRPSAHCTVAAAVAAVSIAAAAVGFNLALISVCHQLASSGKAPSDDELKPLLDIFAKSAAHATVAAVSIAAAAVGFNLALISVCHQLASSGKAPSDDELKSRWDIFAKRS
jgi:N-formylglutamate amidohydrolase